MDEKKSIEVVSGDGSNLDISPAYDHLNVEAPKTNTEKPKNIIIPKVTNKKSKKDDKDNDDNKNDSNSENRKDEKKEN